MSGALHEPWFWDTPWRAGTIGHGIYNWLVGIRLDDMSTTSVISDLSVVNDRYADADDTCVCPSLRSDGGEHVTDGDAPDRGAIALIVSCCGEGVIGPHDNGNGLSTCTTLSVPVDRGVGDVGWVLVTIYVYLASR